MFLIVLMLLDSVEELVQSCVNTLAERKNIIGNYDEYRYDMFHIEKILCFGRDALPRTTYRNALIYSRDAEPAADTSATCNTSS